MLPKSYIKLKIAFNFKVTSNLRVCPPEKNSVRALFEVTLINNRRFILIFSAKSAVTLINQMIQQSYR